MQAVAADADDLVRMGLCAVLHLVDQIAVVDEAKDLDDLVAMLEKHRPPLAVIDLELPGLPQLTAMAAPLREVVPDVKVIVVSDSTTDTAVVRTFRAECDGFVVKQDARETLPAAVSAVARGGTFIDPMVGSILIALASKGQRSYGGPYGLTVQEQRVAVLLVDELTNRQIGEELAISPGTVKTHVANAVGKLGAHDRYDAAAIIEREGITAPGS